MAKNALCDQRRNRRSYLLCPLLPGQLPSKSSSALSQVVRFRLGLVVRTKGTSQIHACLDPAAVLQRTVKMFQSVNAQLAHVSMEFDAFLLQIFHRLQPFRRRSRKKNLVRTVEVPSRRRNAVTGLTIFQMCAATQTVAHARLKLAIRLPTVHAPRKAFVSTATSALRRQHPPSNRRFYRQWRMNLLAPIVVGSSRL